MIWYFIVGILYVFVSFIGNQGFKSKLNREMSESLLPQAVLFLTVLFGVILWPIAFVTDIAETIHGRIGRNK